MSPAPRAAVTTAGSDAEPAVVTVGSIHGGTKHNIISDEVKLQLTIRAFSEKVRHQLVEGIERRAKALSEAHRAPAPTVEVEEYTPATVNSPDLVQRVKEQRSFVGGASALRRTGSDNRQCDSSHGTHVAGIVGAQGSDGAGVSGGPAQTVGGANTAPRPDTTAAEPHTDEAQQVEQDRKDQDEVPRQ